MARGVVAGLVVTGIAGALAPVAVAEAPPLEPIETERIIALDEFPRPDGFELTDLRAAPDFDHLVLGLKREGQEHFGVANADGSGFDCLSCGLVPNANKVKPLADERRIWFASNDSQGRDQTEIAPGLRVPLPGQGGTGDFQWFVLECSPSIYACAERRVLDVEFPIDSLLEGAQNREASPDPNGDYVAWNEVRGLEGTRMTVAKLERRDDRYVLAAPRVFNPPYDTTGDAANWIPGSRFYEGGSWHAGNRFLKYQTTTTALNYDTYLLDVRTGRREQVTTDLDYNEIGEYSPDGRWGAVASARGLDRMDIFTQLVRPPLLDMVSFGQIGRVSLWNNRRCMNELWLWDRTYGQRLGGYSGQPIRFEDDWTVREFEWYPDGTRALVREELIPNHPEPRDAERRVRFRIVRLPARTPTAPPPTLDLDDMDVAAWTIPASQYQGMASRQVPGRTLRGPGGGTATVIYAGTFAAGIWKVRFDGWSDDGMSFVSGTEALITPNPILEATWSADLTVRGAHTGFLRGTVHVGPQNTFSGEVISEVDGRRYDRIPTQADCPGLRQPPLAVDDVDVTRRGRGRTDIAVRVTAEIPEDATHRPIRFATVTVGAETARTGDDGVARLTLLRPQPDAVTIQAQAATFKDAARQFMLPPVP